MCEGWLDPNPAGPPGERQGLWVKQLTDADVTSGKTRKVS